MTKYEALEKINVPEPEIPQLCNLKYSRNSRKPRFIGRFSVYSRSQNRGRGATGGGRRNWESIQVGKVGVQVIEPRLMKATEANQTSKTSDYPSLKRLPRHDDHGYANLGNESDRRHL
jgi:hypothetical protein